MVPLDGSPIGVADNLCPYPCPEVAPESDRSHGGAVGDTPLGGTVNDAPLGGPVGPASWEPGGFDLPG